MSRLEMGHRTQCTRTASLCRMLVEQTSDLSRSLPVCYSESNKTFCPGKFIFLKYYFHLKPIIYIQTNISLQPNQVSLVVYNPTLTPNSPDGCMDGRCISMALPCRIISCFSCRLASRKMAKQVNIIMVQGIQNDMELEMTAQYLFTTNEHCVGFWMTNCWCCGVVYQPMKMGKKESSAGDIHVFSSIMPTTRFVMLIGYLRGLTIAQYL